MVLYKQWYMLLYTAFDLLFWPRRLCNPTGSVKQGSCHHTIHPSSSRRLGIRAQTRVAAGCPSCRQQDEPFAQHQHPVHPNKASGCMLRVVWAAEHAGTLPLPGQAAAEAASKAPNVHR